MMIVKVDTGGGLSLKSVMQNPKLVQNIRNLIKEGLMSITVQQDAPIYSLFNLWSALHVSGGICTNHQELMSLYPQHLALVWPLLQPVGKVVGLELSTIDTVIWAPDDGWWYHPKHVQQFTDTNKLYIVASCWTIIDIYWHNSIVTQVRERKRERGVVFNENIHYPLLSLHSVDGRWLNGYGALEWYWQEKSEDLGEKHVSFLTWTDPGSNSGSQVEGSVTNPLSHMI
jgi:hypothetical protein